MGQPLPEDQASDILAASPGPTVCQDYSNLVAKFDRVDRLLNMSCWERAETNSCPEVIDIIDVSYALKSLIEKIRNELELPLPSESAQ